MKRGNRLSSVIPEDPRSSRRVPDRPETQPEASRLGVTDLRSPTLRPWAQVCVEGLLLTLGLLPGTLKPWGRGAGGRQRDGEQVKGILCGLASLDKDTSNERQLVLGTLTAPGLSPAAAE